MKQSKFVKGGALLAGGLLSALALALLASRHFLPPSPPPPSLLSPPPPGSVDFRGVESLVIRSGGKKVWELFVDKIRVNQWRTRTLLEGLKKAVYYRNGKPVATIFAQRATYEHLTKDFEVSGEVTVKSVSGLVAKTELVRWRHRDAKLQCPFKVFGNAGDLRFFTKTLAFYPKDELLRCREGAFLGVDGVQVYCYGADIDLRKEILRLLKPVRLRARVGEDLEELERLPLTLEMWKHSLSGGVIYVANAEKGTDKANKKKRVLHVDASEFGDVRQEKEGGKTVLRLPGAFITEEGEDYLIKVGRSNYYPRDDRVEVLENIRFEDPDLIMTAPRATVLGNQRRIVFVGPVRLETKPKKKEEPNSHVAAGGQGSEANNQGKNGQGANKKPNDEQPASNAESPKPQKEGDEELPLKEQFKKKKSVITCEKGAEYFYSERRAVVNGGVEFKQEQKRAVANRCTYLARDDLLILEGNVHGEDKEDESVFSCDKVTWDLDDDTAVFEKLKGRFRLKDEDSEKEKKPEAPQKGKEPESKEKQEEKKSESKQEGKKDESKQESQESPQRPE